jgi:phosphoribosylaminoimidazole carboxylase
MLNVLGAGDDMLEQTQRPIERALSIAGAAIHWYGKEAVRAQRKMGHITLVAPTMAELAARLAQLDDRPPTTDHRPPTTDHGGSKIEDRGSIFGDPRSSILDPQPVLGSQAPLVGIIMGSDSDLPIMRQAAEVLRDFGVPFELTIVSAHRTVQRMLDYARTAHGRGLRAIIAGAGGAAHLPGMVASLTPLPVIGVPIPHGSLGGQDALLSIVQMPRGIPVATVAIGNAANAGLLALRILAAADPALQRRMSEYQEALEQSVLDKVSRLDGVGWQHYEVKRST